MRSRFLSTLLIATVAATAARAQTATSGKSAVLSIQPITSMLTIYTGELELAMSPSATIGVGTTYWSPDFDGEGFTYLSGDLKVRYYPDARAFQGFSFGGSVGLTRVSASSSNTQDNGSVTKPSIGLMLDYNWLLGANKAFYVGIGAGAKAVFINEDEFNNQSLTFRYPTARLSVGWAF
jgi:uncharacterized protein DUF3575